MHLLPSLRRQDENQASFVPEMFIYAPDLPKDMEKTLLQVMTVEPQYIIHSLL